MTRSIQTILLLIGSNTFMTIAWYGHLRFKEISFLQNLGLVGTILLSWGIALIEYCLMVPANKIGSNLNNGPFSLWELKIIQEAVSISVFIAFTLVFFKTETFKWNHALGFVFLILAVFFIFKK
jgi:uncharacterized protein